MANKEQQTLLFTHDQIAQRVNELLGPDLSVVLDTILWMRGDNRGPARNERILLTNGLILAKRVTYRPVSHPNTAGLEPIETMGLYGDDEGGRPIAVEYTAFRLADSTVYEYSFRCPYKFPAERDVTESVTVRDFGEDPFSNLPSAEVQEDLAQILGIL